VEAIAIGDEARCFVGNDGAAACGIRGFRRAPGGFHSHYSPVRASLVTYRTLDAGAFHVCGVTDDFELYCWGHNGAGQTDVPEGQFESVSGGQWHSCAIDINDMLSCWGENAYGQSAPPAGSFRAVDAGGRHTCAIATDQQLHCWGDNSHKQSQPPPGEWVAVSSGDEHSCAISVDKALACWGSNEYGQTDIPGGKWVQVDVGAFEDWGTEFCALREDGVVSCANNLQTYALYGFWDGRTVDVPKAPVGRWMALDLGSNQRCLQDESQQVQCWRWNERHGQVTEYLAPIPPNPAGYRKFSAGGRYVCLIDEEQRLSCVRSSGGWNRDHADEHDPHPVTILPGRYTDLAVGSHHVCAIDQVGDVECVHLDKGINQSLMPDLPPMPNLSEPVAAVSVDPHEWRECATNQVPECPDAPACLLTKSGRVLCWGGGSGDRWDIGATPSITQIGVGCGLDNAGKIHCWDDTKTHLGQATGPFTSLGSSGASHCATTVSGNIHCWGSIGFVIENRELTHGSFLIPGVKIAAVRPGPDRLPPPRAERVDDH